MSRPRKYVVDSRSRVAKRKARQQKETENLQTLLQETPTASFSDAFENIAKNVDVFMSQLETSNRPINISEIKKFMAARSTELKALRKTLPPTATITKRELNLYIKMLLGITQQLTPAKKTEVKHHTPVVESNIKLRLGM